MNKQQYLANADVAAFIAWLKDKLDNANASLGHSYLNRKMGFNWQCDSVFDAYQKYDWPFRYTNHNGTPISGRTFNRNEQALNSIKQQLREAFIQGHQQKLIQASCMVFKWGGVAHGNENWAKNHENLIGEYRIAQQLLNPHLADDEKSCNFKFNSGLSKVYSLLIDDFIIYDSRVGAALGWLVIKYCQAKNLPFVPELLAFPWAAAKEGVNAINPKNRNPSQGNYRIPPIGNNPDNHARWNLRASWLLADLANSNNSFKSTNDPLRALEAALFMIGYDLPLFNQQPSNAVVQQQPIVVDNADFNLRTRGHNLSFKAVLSSTDKSVIFRHSPRPRPDDTFTFKEICQIVNYLFNHFGLNEFPLANNVEYLGKNTEKKGLGMAIRSIGADVTKAQAASYLGPYLEEVGVFHFVHTNPITWQLLNKPAFNANGIDDDIINALCDYHAES